LVSGAPAAWLWTLTGSYDGMMVAVFAGSLLMATSFWLAAAVTRGSGSP